MRIQWYSPATVSPVWNLPGSHICEVYQRSNQWYALIELAPSAFWNCSGVTVLPIAGRYATDADAWLAARKQFAAGGRR